MPDASTPTTRGEVRHAVSSPALLIAVLCSCGIVVSLMQTLIVPIIPQLPVLLHASLANASWAITATLLASAVMTPIMGRLGDMFGKKKILVLCLVSMIIGSLLCAVFSALIPVVVGRALQGVAIGSIPLGISILRDELPAERVSSGIAIMSATLGVGGAIGLPVAAIIVQTTNWHALFWISAALGALCLTAVLTVVRESPVRTPARFDFVGAVGLGVGLTALLIAVTKGGDWGWASARVLGLAGGAVLLLLAWGALELRTAAPLVDLRVSAKPRVLYTNITSILVGFAMYGTSLTLPQILLAPKDTGYGFGMSLIAAGFALAPGGVLMMLLSPVSARLTAARGPKVTLMAGTTIMMVGYIIALTLHNSFWEISAAAAVVAAGLGFAYGAMPALIMSAVPLSETAAANGLNSLMRSVGTSLSAAVLSVVLAQITMDYAGRSIPSATGFRTTFLISIGACVAALCLAAFIPMKYERTVTKALNSDPVDASEFAPTNS